MSLTLQIIVYSYYVSDGYYLFVFIIIIIIIIIIEIIKNKISLGFEKECTCVRRLPEKYSLKVPIPYNYTQSILG